MCIYEGVWLHTISVDNGGMGKRGLATLAALPPALMALGWARYRKAVDELDSHQPSSPVLPGRRVSIPTPVGRVSYRLITGAPDQPAVVLIHGWGRTGDSAWWPIVWRTNRTILLVDLPGHGQSTLDARFTMEAAADAVVRIVKHAELDKPAIVGHSMGGAVALLAAKQLGEAVSHIGILASASHWVQPKMMVTLAAAPYVMAPRSPIVVRRHHRATTEIPAEAGRVVWEYAARPARRVLEQTAQELRTFDARSWDSAELAPMTWMVATEDGIIDPDNQRESAQLFGAEIIEIESEHSVVVDHPHAVADFIDGLGIHQTPISSS